MTKFKPYHLGLILIVAISLSVGGLVLAQDGGAPPQGPPPQGPDGAFPDPGRQDAYNALWEDYLAKTKPIHDELVDQRLIYRALVGNSNASVADVKKSVADMRALRERLDTEEEAFSKALAEAGFGAYAKGPGHGRHGGPRGHYGRGYRGPGHGGYWGGHGGPRGGFRGHGPWGRGGGCGWDDGAYGPQAGLQGGYGPGDDGYFDDGPGRDGSDRIGHRRGHRGRRQAQ
ncbi:MAG: hypothetical protein LBE49_01935 [Deltaproteobacteria bacterium]|jgi:hypothetical protein|nr:hypothetical protein [Deltaproteobacteria bacterium]